MNPCSGSRERDWQTLLLTAIFLCILGIGQVVAAKSPGIVEHVQLFDETQITYEENQVKVKLTTDAFARSNRSVGQLVAVPVKLGETVELELEPYDIIAPEARFLIGSPGGDEPIARPQVVTLKGRIAGDPHSFAFVSVSASGMLNGFIERNAGEGYTLSTLSDDLKAVNQIVTIRPTAGFNSLEVPFCGTEVGADLFRGDRARRTHS
jgi:hypothetical protein